MLQITKEVAASAIHTLGLTHAPSYFDIVDEFWGRITKEQPHLCDVLTAVLKSTKDSHTREMLAHGFFIAMYTIYAQEEIEVMNEEWGL